MNTWQKRSVAALTVALLGAGGWGVAAAQADPTAPAPAPTAATASADAALVRNLTFMREEERLARDLYAAFAQKYGADTAFARITTSEQRHFDAVGVLLTRYGIADPSAGRAAGSFADPGLQKLYDDLLAQGNESLQKAYEAGVAVEEEDIADLKAALRDTTAADATRVLSQRRPRAGSRRAGRAPGRLPGALSLPVGGGRARVSPKPGR